MTIKTRAQLVTAYGDPAFDFGKPGDELVRDMVDSMGMGKWEQIGSTQTVGSAVASVDFTSIPSTYGDLRILFDGVSHDNGSNTTIGVAVSSNNGGAYSSSASTHSLGNASQQHYGSFIIFDYASLLIKPFLRGTHVALDTSGAALGAGAFSTTSAIDAIRVSAAAGNLDAGSISLWGR